MTYPTTPTSGAAELPEALLAAIDNYAETYHRLGDWTYSEKCKAAREALLAQVKAIRAEPAGAGYVEMPAASEFQVDTYSPRSNGGFSLRADVAVRIKHTPTGVEVTSSGLRSQHANRHRAWELMQQALFDTVRASHGQAPAQPEVAVALNGQLYAALGNLFSHLGAEGCVGSDHPFVWDAMTALKRIDGGVYLDDLAVPVDPDAHRDDLLNAVQLLEDGEWAEHFAKTPLGMRLEDQITKLHGEAGTPTPQAADTPAQQPAPAREGEREAFEEWAKGRGYQRDELARSKLALVSPEYFNPSVESAWQAWQARAAQAPAVPAVMFGNEDHVLVPRGLIGAACSIIANERKNSSKTLAELRRYTVGDLSQAQGAGITAPTTRIPLPDGAELSFEPYTIGSPRTLWCLRKCGAHIRWLDEFESKFVNAALAATPQPAPPADSVLEDAAPDHIRALIAQHAAILEQNESSYFELCYHRATGWMAWITDKPLCMPPVINPDRKVLAQGQGDTPDEACADAARKQGGA